MMNTIEDKVSRYYGNIAQNKNSCCAPTEKQASDPNIFSLGCGIGGAEDAKPGEYVLDLGSGTGHDVFIAAGKVGPDGSVIGVDMTEEMITKAFNNSEKLGLKNVQFKLGKIDKLPQNDDSIDLVISNCVINLTPYKSRVFKEIHRVLKPGGRVIIQDTVSEELLPESITSDQDLWNSCVGGAIPVDTYLEYLKEAGFEDIRMEDSVSMNIQDIKLLSVRIRAFKTGN